MVRSQRPFSSFEHRAHVDNALSHGRHVAIDFAAAASGAPLAAAGAAGGRTSTPPVTPIGARICTVAMWGMDPSGRWRRADDEDDDDEDDDDEDDEDDDDDTAVHASASRPRRMACA